MLYVYEIFLRHGRIGKTEWNEFLLQIAAYLDSFASWEIEIRLEYNLIHYYLCTSRPMPASLNLIDFLLKPTTQPTKLSTASRGYYRNEWSDNFVTILQELYKRQYKTCAARITFHSFISLIYGQIKITYSRGNRHYLKRLLLFYPSAFLSIDFDKSKTFLFKKFPKYLKLEKVTPLLTTESECALLEIDPFPYLESSQYLKLNSYDFAKHSLVVGSSGSGKSRFLTSFIHKISRLDNQDYKIVVIDPHDAMYQDCLNIESTKIINFQTESNSINLFSSDIRNINANVELMLSLFRSLINNDYNGRLERVLRYATYLLVAAGEFSFITLRKLLLDLEYRNSLVAQYRQQVPVSVTHFFLTDFNELKSQNYNDAIAPIVAFIDEIQMIPVFNSERLSLSLSHLLEQNFLSIFSLNRLRLGDKVSKTIAGLLLQQLFLLAQHHLSQHLILIIDEVAVIESPIISRFLSEMRKYNVSVILAGQYFDQVTPSLRSAIFANTTNYYLFRTSQSDAELLTKNLKIQIEGNDNIEESQKLLNKLKARECLVQISANEEALPIFKARTADYCPVQNNSCPSEQLFNYDIVDSSALTKPITLPSAAPNEFQFDIGGVDMEQINQDYSTSRKIKE